MMSESFHVVLSKRRRSHSVYLACDRSPSFRGNHSGLLCVVVSVVDVQEGSKEMFSSELFGLVQLSSISECSVEQRSEFGISGQQSVISVGLAE